jgi:hypothetical protein
MNTVEFNTRFKPSDDTFVIGEAVAMITPPVGQDYWLFRVKLFKEHAIIGFPKFSTIGIGFAIEDADWNTNLPYDYSPEQIYSHIKANRKYDEITKEECIKAIALITKHCKAFKAKSKSSLRRKLNRIAC